MSAFISYVCEIADSAEMSRNEAVDRLASSDSSPQGLKEEGVVILVSLYRLIINRIGR